MSDLCHDAGLAGPLPSWVPAEARTYLDRRGLLFAPGPTGTNVMDLVLGLVPLPGGD